MSRARRLRRRDLAWSVRRRASRSASRRGATSPGHHAARRGPRPRAARGRARPRAGVVHPFHDVAIVGVYNTQQARVLEGSRLAQRSRSRPRSARSPTPALASRDVDGVIGASGQRPHLPARDRSGVALDVGAGHPRGDRGGGAIATGSPPTVLIAAGSAGVYTERASTAPWTRPTNEFVAPYGMFTAAEFALIARRHMHMYGSTPEQFATVAATIRNNGHVHPTPSTSGGGRSRVDDILDSRMVADPFHLLDCAMTSEGGCGDRARRAPTAPATCRTTRLRARRQHRPLRPVVPAPPGVGHRRPGAPDLVDGRRARRPRPRSPMAGLGPTTSTCASSTTRSRSRSSASSRRSSSAPRARAATS